LNRTFTKYDFHKKIPATLVLFRERIENEKSSKIESIADDFAIWFVLYYNITKLSNIL